MRVRLPVLAMTTQDDTTHPIHLDPERRYRDLYENMPLMFFEMDDQGVVVSVNTFGAEQLGYEASELVGKSVMNVFHEDDREAVAEQFKSLIATGDGLASWELRKRRKDGSVLWVRETARVVRTQDERVEVMVVCQDISARKRAEEEHREAERLVRELSVQLGEEQEREKRRIAVHLHDGVGQTLTLAQIKLSMFLDNGRSDPELLEVKSLIQRSIEDTRSLTFELASPVLYELGLTDALRSLCDRQPADSETRFLFEGTEDAFPASERVAVPLYRIASELVHNVRRHAQAELAWVRLDCGDGRVVLTVRDDGKGFDPASIHEPSGEPTGIGLFSIEQRVDLLGGRLEIQSQPGKGTTITVSFQLETGPS